ncbi:hypothetical protein GCM10007857_85680 [Bradyrhizobium iriomotense]|uniref:DDE domain-containing protein n=1 Tax=Bradyrhizobium iriomotense TaxID=441950 RepID=A0ABQ6BBX2_9BRAD|nr:hypothetical protein GCM10007857_85680 [Bradyrhizobium iriomotense]
MFDVRIAQRGRKGWEWRVIHSDETLLMRGRNRTRPEARYQAYRALLLLLAAQPGKMKTVPRS